MNLRSLVPKSGLAGMLSSVVHFILTELTTILAFIFAFIAIYQLSLALGIL